MMYLIETGVVPYGLGGLFVGGALVWAAIVTGLFNRNKTGADTRKVIVETTASEQQLIEDRIEFLTNQANAYKKLYDDVSEKYRLSEELSKRKERDCEEKIDRLQTEVQQLQEVVARLTTQIGLK